MPRSRQFGLERGFFLGVKMITLLFVVVGLLLIADILLRD